MIKASAFSPFARTKFGRLLAWAAIGSCLVAVTWIRWTRIESDRAAAAGHEVVRRRDVPRPRPDQYVSSNECRSCHPGEYASWHRTYHRTMTQLATPENVLGEFDGTTVASEGLQYRVFREGDEYWAEMPDPEELMYIVQGGKPTPLAKIPRVKRQVVMSTGSHHYQTYWVTGDKKYGNLLQTLPLVYLPEHKRWIPREAAFVRPPNGERMVTQWNNHCIRCHSTGGVPGLMETTEEGEFNTMVGELGIACEACHGPAEEHVRHYRSPLARYAARLGDATDSSIVNPARLDHRRSSQVCGQCHGVFVMQEDFAMEYAYEGVGYRPGADLHQTRYMIEYPTDQSTPEQQEELANNPDFFRGRWWRDGTILAGGREFTAMSASGCYQRGEISCLSCHTMHHGDPNDQLKPQMQTNAACTSCHREKRFQSELETHTRHRSDSAGSNCLNCHMPHTAYALFRAIRSHQISSPNAASSIKHGAPNACNACHLDKTLAWTQDQLADWFGHERLHLTDDQQNVAAGALWMLQGDAALRVIAGWHAGWEPAQEASGVEWLAPYVSALLADSYGVVRYVADRSLRKLPGFEDFSYDFMAEHRALSVAAANAVARWTAEATATRRRGAELLIDDNGLLMADEYRRLLRGRDHRPVHIRE